MTICDRAHGNCHRYRLTGVLIHDENEYTRVISLGYFVLKDSGVRVRIKQIQFY